MALLGRSAGSEAMAVAGAITSMRIDDLIFHLAEGIADGQGKLDDVCMEIAAFMGEPRIAFGKNPRTGKSEMVSLLELGFAPNFYQFVDSILEVKVAITSSYEESYERGSSQTRAYRASKTKNTRYGSSTSTKTSTESGGGIFGDIFGGGSGSSTTRSSSYNRVGITEKSTRLNVMTVDANYSSTYNFSVEGSSSIKTKIVPIPAPTLLEERIHALLEESKDEEERNENLYGIKIALPIIINAARDLALGDTANEILKTSEGDLTKDIITANSEKLKLDIDLINQNHAGITDAQWAVVGNLVHRQYADQYIQRLVSNAGIIASFEEGGDLDAIKEVVASVKSDLKTYGDHMQGILSALPPTPEEKIEEAKTEAEEQPE
jgi:hypothetical protein